jgi:hypothetical protein
LPAAERHETTSMITVIRKLKKLTNRKIIIYTWHNLRQGTFLACKHWHPK